MPHGKTQSSARDGTCSFPWFPADGPKRWSRTRSPAAARNGRDWRNCVLDAADATCTSLPLPSALEASWCICRAWSRHKEQLVPCSNRATASHSKPRFTVDVHGESPASLQSAAMRVCWMRAPSRMHTRYFRVSNVAGRTPLPGFPVWGQIVTRRVISRQVTASSLAACG